MDGLTALLFVAMFLLVSHLQGGLKAYLDPNTGSMALQLLLAGVVAFLATLRAYRERIKAFFARRQAPPLPRPSTATEVPSTRRDTVRP